MSEKPEIYKLSGLALETARHINGTTKAIQQQLDELSQRYNRVNEQGQAELRAMTAALLHHLGLSEEAMSRLERLDLSYLDATGDAYVVLRPAERKSGGEEAQTLN